MGLEVATFITDLISTNPVGATDQKKFGDDHLRLIKAVLKTQFPNLGSAAISATAAELNKLTGSQAFMATFLQAATETAARVALQIAGQIGQCQLKYQSTIQIRLVPFNGNKITIAGNVYEIPAAGVNFPNTGLFAAKEYDIYVYDSAGTLTLEAVDHAVTVHVVDTTAGNVGVRIKSGDATRTLVGKVYMDAGSPGLFAPHYTISWFNRRNKTFTGEFTANRTTASVWATLVELHSEIRVNFVTWGDETILDLQASAFAPTTKYTTIGVDGITGRKAHQFVSDTISNWNTINCSEGAVLAEGQHYCSVYGAVAGGTGTWAGGNFGCLLSATIRG